MEGTTFSILMFVLGLVFGIIILLLANYFKNKKDENKALSIIESAKKEADIIKKEAVSEAKEETFNLKQDMEAELKALVKDTCAALPSYKAITKTIIVNEPIDHSVVDRLCITEW